MIWSEFNKDRYLVPLPPLYIYFMQFRFNLGLILVLCLLNS